MSSLAKAIVYGAASLALYALEMNRGWFAQRGIRPGMRLGGIPGK